MKISWLRAGVLSALAAWAGFAHADFSGSLGTITPNGTVAFHNSNVTTGTSAPPSYNFLDQWAFALGANASISSIATTIYFTGPGGSPTFGITNLQINLVSNPVSGSPIVSWLTVTMTPGVDQLVALTPLSSLGAGDYFIEVRGTLSSPGSYAGSLIATPAVVPLPGALPLLVAGLGAFGVLGTRRRRAPH